MFRRLLIPNGSKPVPGLIRTAQSTAIAAAILALGIADTASACSVLTEARQRREKQRQQRYLERHADRVVVGTFRADPGGREQDENYVLRGVVEVARRGRVERYRVSISGTINCGFPFYFVEDGDYGRFYLEREEYPEDDDRADGVIDNYQYVHFVRFEQES
ncbi:MAG TPA: hypothetical protein VI168_06965 [Croceibacterium sp.]